MDFSEYKKLCDEYIERLTAERVAIFKANADYNLSQKATDFVTFNDRVQEILYSRTVSDWAFITINTRPGTTCVDLIEAVQDLAAKFNWSIWSYEMGKNGNLHCHFLGEIDSYTTNWSRKIKTPFSSICNTSNKNCFYVRFPKTISELPKIKDYIIKTNVAKSKKIADDATRIFREENNLAGHYSLGEGPSCLSLPLINLD